MLKNKRISEISGWLSYNKIINYVSISTHESPKVQFNITPTIKLTIIIILGEIEFTLFKFGPVLSVKKKAIIEDWFVFESDTLGYNDYKSFYTSEEAIDEIKQLLIYCKKNNFTN